MATETKIEWTHREGTVGKTWNPTTGCDRISSGCDHCYALTLAKRLQGMGSAKYQNDGDPRTSGPGFGVTLHPAALGEPLRWRKPTTVFVNSMSDLFHAKVPREFVVQIFAVMAATPQHTYQILTKRPERMARILNDPEFPHLVARELDRINVQKAIDRMGAEQRRPIGGQPGYWVTDRGRVLLEGGSNDCVWCGAPIPESATARTRFCSQRCNSKVHFERSQGRWQEKETFRALRPDSGDQGHQRVVLGDRRHHLVHRLVLTAFDRAPESPTEQACHRNGDPTINALPNLRWGSQSANWTDRKRHGNGRAHALPDTPARTDFDALGFEWPLHNVWAGTSIESDEYVRRADALRATPAAVRFISAEPLLGPLPSLDLTDIDWLIAGGESGPGSRPMDLAWVRDLITRCRAAGTAPFVKQLGSVWARDNFVGGESLAKCDKKGGDWTHWDADLRVREYPRVTEAVSR